MPAFDISHQQQSGPSLSDSGSAGDAFFGNVYQSPQSQFDWVDKIIVPVTVSVIAGMFLLALKGREKNAVR